jgi:hypothetical protein
VPSAAIPAGQRYVKVKYAPSSAMVHEFPGVFVRQELLKAATTVSAVVYADGTAAAKLPDVTVNYRPYHDRQTISPILAFASTPELYINNIFVLPYIHTIFVERVGFQLIRVHRAHVSAGQSSDGSVQLTNLKWPTEYIFVGFRPSNNADSTTNPNVWRDWHRFCKVYDAVQDDRIEQVQRTPATFAEADPNTIATHITTHTSVGAIVPNTFPIEVPVIDTLKVTAHGVTLSNDYAESFYSSYIPYQFGAGTIASPSSRGAMMVTFSLYPGMRQASGHINISRAREFYIAWTTSFAATAANIVLYCSSIAINFLIVAQGAVNLRYTT